jgi:hypothetical protein
MKNNINMKKTLAFKSLMVYTLVFGGFALPVCQADQDLSDLCSGKWKGSFFKEKSHDENRIREGDFSLVYHSSEDLSGKEGVLEFTPPLDLTQWQGLKFWVYSERANPGTITIALVNTTKTDNGADAYFYYRMKTDFEGWKEISVPFADFQQVREASWDAITSIRLWDFSGNPVAEDTALYFSGMKIIPSGQP